MKFLKEEKNCELTKDRIFKIAKLAFEAKANGNVVYNATLGTLYNEDETFYTNEEVYTTFENLERRQIAAYAPAVDGGERFANAVKNWVFQNNEFLKVSKVVATPGGTGALSTAFFESVKENEEIIIPNIFWGPYEIIMKSRNIKPKRCECFKENEFSIEPLKEAMKDVLTRQNNIVIVINDPCHNPTGYSMGIEKWQELIAFCNEIATKDKTVTIINDIAYIDYSHNFETSRDYMQTFKEINDNVLVVIAFSGSKSLTAYGMRIGAAIVYAKQNEDIERVHAIYERVARGTWSNVNNGALHTIVDLFEKPERFMNTLKEASSMLANRIRVYLEEADKVGLKYYPTKEGFFVTLVGIEGQNEALFEKLKAKNIFVVPMVKGIRVAICSLPLTHCKVLPKMIQAVIEEMKHAN